MLNKISSRFWKTGYSAYSLWAIDRFIQPIFFRIFVRIGTFGRGNECDIGWSAATSIGDLWKRTKSISPNLTSSYSISYMVKCCTEESSYQKDSKVLKTYQKSNNRIGVRPLYLSPILHWVYSKRYMAGFWCGNVLLIGDFKNTKAYQTTRGQQVVRPLAFYPKNLTKLTANLPHKIYS